jgi:hypothetical protein
MAKTTASIKITGFKQTAKRLNRLTIRAVEATQSGLNEVGRKIEKASREQAPIDTGNLKNSSFTIWPKRKSIRMPEFRQVGRRRTISAARLERIRIEHQLTAEDTSRNMQLESLLLEPITKVGHSVFYATLVHKDAARHPPFLTNALQAYEHELVSTVERKVKQALMRNATAQI